MSIPPLLDDSFEWISLENTNNKTFFINLLGMGIHNIVYGEEIDQIGFIHNDYYNTYLSKKVNEEVKFIVDNKDLINFIFDETDHPELNIFTQLIQQRLEYVHGIITEICGNSKLNCYTICVVENVSN